MSWFATDPRRRRSPSSTASPSRVSLGYRVARARGARPSRPGGRSCRRSAPRHRHGAPPRPRARASRPRPPPTRGRARALFQSWALEIERSDVALLDRAEGSLPIRFGFEMRRFLTGRLPEHALPPGLELRPVTPDAHLGDLRGRQRGVPRPLGPSRGGRGRLPRALREPGDRHLRCGASRGTGTRSRASCMNWFYPRRERRSWASAAGGSTTCPCAGAWRGRGLAKALCAASFRVLRRGPRRAWLGWTARTRRARSSSRAPRVPGRPPLVRVRRPSTDRRGGLATRGPGAGVARDRPARFAAAGGRLRHGSASLPGR